MVCRCRGVSWCVDVEVCGCQSEWVDVRSVNVQREVRESR